MACLHFSRTHTSSCFSKGDDGFVQSPTPSTWLCLWPTCRPHPSGWPGGRIRGTEWSNAKPASANKHVRSFNQHPLTAFLNLSNASLSLQLFTQSNCSSRATVLGCLSTLWVKDLFWRCAWDWEGNFAAAWRRVCYGGGPIRWFFYSHKTVPGYGRRIVSMNVDVERKFFKAGPRKERRQKHGKKSRYWWY